MNINDTKVNGHLLRKRLNNPCFKGVSKQGVVECNEGKPYRQTRRWLLWFIALCLIEGGLMVLTKSYAVTCLVAPLGMLVFGILQFREDRRVKQTFDELCTEINADMEKMFEVSTGYGPVIKDCERFKRDVDAYQYLMDWARSQILETCYNLEKGGELARERLFARYEGALAVFGNELDRGAGIECFFSRDIVVWMEFHLQRYAYRMSWTEKRAARS